MLERLTLDDRIRSTFTVREKSGRWPIFPPIGIPLLVWIYRDGVLCEEVWRKGLFAAQAMMYVGYKPFLVAWMIIPEPPIFPEQWGDTFPRGLRASNA